MKAPDPAPPGPDEDWLRLKDVFEGARALPADSRPAYLAAAVQGGSDGCPRRITVEAGEGVAVQHYAVSKDGTRFLVDVIQDVTAPITVVLNWKPRE